MMFGESPIIADLWVELKDPSFHFFFLGHAFVSALIALFFCKFLSRISAASACLIAAAIPVLMAIPIGSVLDGRELGLEPFLGNFLVPRVLLPELIFLACGWAAAQVVFRLLRPSLVKGLLEEFA
jgi:hypothetical protein